MMASVTLTLLSLLGPPGSGKGTLAARCVEKKGFLVLSTGNLCRQHIAEKTEIGILIEKYIASGELIPHTIIVKMVNNWLSEQPEGATVLLDGFPRTVEQAGLFVPDVEQKGASFQVVLFDISPGEVVERLSNRLVCSNPACQAVYSKTAKPPKVEGVCDVCKSELISRADDDEEVIRQRLSVYAQHKEGLLAWYEENDVSIAQLAVGGKSRKEVYELFCSTLGDV